MDCFYQRSKEEISYIDVNMDTREVYFVMQNRIYRVPVDTKYVEEMKIVDNANVVTSITGEILPRQFCSSNMRLSPS